MPDNFKSRHEQSFIKQIAEGKGKVVIGYVYAFSHLSFVICAVAMQRKYSFRIGLPVLN